MAEWISRCPNGHESMTFDTHCGVCGEVVISHRAGRTPARPQAPIFVSREPSNPSSLFGERTCSNGHKIDSIDLFCGICGEEVDAAAPPLAVTPKLLSAPTSGSSSFDSVSTRPDSRSENVSCVRGHTATPVNTHCRVCGKQLKSLRPTGLDRSGPAPHTSANRATQRPRWIKTFGRRHKKGIQVAALILFGSATAFSAIFAGRAFSSSGATACPTDTASLKQPLQPHFVSEYLTHIGVSTSSIKFAIANKYIYFTTESADGYDIQTTGIFLRCDSGGWSFLAVVDGWSCSPTWTWDDRAAAVDLGICPK